MDLRTIAQQANKKFGDGSALSLNPDTFEKRRYDGVSSGSYMLNHLLTGTHDKAWVFGKIYELYGTEGSGKTTICLHAAIECQKAGLSCAYIDMEHALDAHYARQIGVDLSSDKFVLSQPSCGEDAFELIRFYTENGVKLIIVDSVASLTPKAMLEGNVGDSHVALLARMMSQELNKLHGIIPKHGSILIFTNQLRRKVGVLVGSNEVTTGGESLKFYVSGARIDVRSYRGDKVTSSKKLSDKADGMKSEESGTNITVKTVKNKLAPPFRSIKLAIDYGKGINKRSDCARFGLLTDVVETVTDKQFRYQGKMCNFSTASKEVFQEIKKQSIKAYKGVEL